MVSLQDKMFQKFNSDTEWAVRLISKITNDEDIPIEGGAIVKQLLALQVNGDKYFFGMRKGLVEFDEVLEYPRRWNLGKLLKEFMTISGKLLDDSFAGITEESLLKSLADLHELNSIDIGDVHHPNLPRPPNAFKGIRKKSSSLKRWLAICTDDMTENGRYHATTNLHRKYLGDFLIASYLDVIQESGYDDAYVKEVERAVLVKTLDCFWRDHLVNMNRLSSAVNVRSFGHRNPLEEYKIDGCRFFISMLSVTRGLTVESLVQYWSSPMECQELFAS